jgi:hypothetical protein
MADTHDERRTWWDRLFPPEAKRLEVALPLLLIGILPTLVFAAANEFLNAYGTAPGYLAAPAVFDGNAEAAGRLRVLAASAALTGASLAALLYFLGSLRFFTRASARVVLIIYVIAATLCLLLMLGDAVRQPQTFLGEQQTCRALNMVEAEAAGAGPRTAVKIAPAVDAKVALPRASSPPPDQSCNGGRYLELKNLHHFHRYALAVVTPALVLGALSFGAAPRRGTAEEAKRRARTMNEYLYISAAVLVLGLLYLSATLRWPAHALHPLDRAAYLEHVDALVLYWGVVYSLYIVSFYVPIALWMGRNFGSSAVFGKGEDAALRHPLSLIKLGTTIFAPAIAGLIGNAVATG